MDMTYDEQNEIFVVFGGGTNETWSDETWIFNFKKNYWNKIEIDNGSSARETEKTMIYDKINHKIIMFGGYTGEYESDTWELKIEAIEAFSLSTSDNIDSSESVLLSSTTINPSDTETSQKDEFPILFLIPFTIIFIVRVIWRKAVLT